MTRLRLREDDLYWQEVDDEIVILEGRGSTYMSVNESGVLLWRLLTRGATKDEVVSSLMAAYGLDARSAEVDADRFVEQMRAAGLLAT